MSFTFDVSTSIRGIQSSQEAGTSSFGS